MCRVRPLPRRKRDHGARVLSARRNLAINASLALVLAGLLVWTLPSKASGAAPVTQPDSLTVVAGSRYTPIRLVANDTDPDGDDLFYCGTEEETPPQIWLLAGGNKKKPEEVWASRKAKPGTYTITYYACDEGFSSSPGTLTLTVLEPLTDQILLKRTGRPGKVRVVNNTTDRVRLLWGAWDTKWKDGATAIRAGKARVITVHRRSLAWVVTSKPEFGL